MQQIFSTNATPAEYQRLGKEFPFPDLTGDLCRKCQKTKMKRHGFYERFLIAKDFQGFICVRRFICQKCGTTVSLLPWFCHPRRVFSTEMIHCALIGLLDWKSSVSAFIRSFASSFGVIFSRQLLYQYRKRIVRNCNRLLMEVTRQFCLDSPASSETEQQKRVRDALNIIETKAPNPCQVSMNMFSHGFCTYLTL